DGVVLDRKVSAGQTVVAAMTTPVLFTLASDLSQMELDVDIDEADVGLLKTALRFVPPDDVKAKAPPQPVPQNGVNWGRIWVQDGGTLRPHDARLGATDGHLTVVLWGDLKEGDLAVTDIAAKPGAKP